MKKPTIYQIKELVKESAPYYFSSKTMKFFGQSLSSFKVYKTEDPTKFLIKAPIKGTKIYSERIFDSLTNTLEFKV